MTQMRLTAAIGVAVVGLVAMLPKSSARGQGAGWEMSHHSFQGPLSYDSDLERWLVSGVSMALKNRMLMMPGIPGRHGLMWHKEPITTRNFELALKFTSKLPEGTGKPDGMFAFWLSDENYTASYNEAGIMQGQHNWTEGLESVGLTVLSSRTNFKGQMFAFMCRDQMGAAKQTLTVTANDGLKHIELKDIPIRGESKERVNIGYLDWVGKDVTMTMRFHADGSVLVRAQAGSEPAATVFTMPAGSISADRNQRWIGFSSWSGTARPINLDIMSFVLTNFDEQVLGEEASDVLSSEAEDWFQTIMAEARYAGEVEQSEAVAHITELLGKYVARYDDLGNKAREKMLKLEGRLQDLGASLMRTEVMVEAWTQDGEGGMNAEKLKSHIKGIRSAISRDDEQHKVKFDKVTAVSKELKDKVGNSVELGEKAHEIVKETKLDAEVLEEYASAGGLLKANFSLVIMVAAVACLGILFMRRMQYYEKKHYI